MRGRALKILPKTKDWLKGLREELTRKRDSLAPVSPTANSYLLEENFDFSSLDYESEGQWPWRGQEGAGGGRRGQEGAGGGRRGQEGAGGGKKGRWEIRENGAGARPHGAGRLLLGWQVAVALTTVTSRLMDPRTGGRQVCEPEPLPPPHCRCLPLPGDVLDDEDDEEYLVEEFGQPLALDGEVGADNPAEAPPSKSPAPARKQQRPTYKGSCL